MAKGLLSVLLVGILFICAGCGSHPESPKVAEDPETPEEPPIRVVASISILSDMVENIAGDRAVVEYIVPIGDNPEDYELIPSDLQKISNACIFFLNGWAVEEAIERSLANVSDSTIVFLTEGITPIPLVGEDAPDPHAWLDAALVADFYVANILNALIEEDPAGEDFYRKNAEEYAEELRELDGWIREQVEAVPEGSRTIVISENAFKYFGEAYGFQTEGIWELNSHEEGTPQQVSRVVDLVVDRGLPAVFGETTVDPRYMEMVSRETGVPIAGLLYTDALGGKNSGAATYVEMMRYNTRLIVEGLSP